MKTNQNDGIDVFTKILFGKGYSHKFRVDHDEIPAPVLHQSTFRISLSMDHHILRTKSGQIISEKWLMISGKWQMISKKMKIIFQK